ncbi:SDR family NAD(P)-dependent oxidoreductase [Siccirubricoccus deserti]
MTGTILVAGGLGGIGQVLCRRLATPGVRLAILGRSPPCEAGELLLGGLRATGAEAAYWQADVTDAAALDRVLGSIRRAFGPVTQVHHLAGVMGRSTLGGKPVAEADAVLAVKIAGALALDAATAADPVEQFVLHGSLAATLGDLGQGDYAMANRFLEAFAEWRAGQRRGRSLCIAWPLWAEGGMQPGPRPRPCCKVFPACRHCGQRTPWPPWIWPWDWTSRWCWWRPGSSKRCCHGSVPRCPCRARQGRALPCPKVAFRNGCAASPPASCGKMLPPSIRRPACSNTASIPSP